MATGSSRWGGRVAPLVSDEPARLSMDKIAFVPVSFLTRVQSGLTRVEPGLTRHSVGQPGPSGTRHAGKPAASVSQIACPWIK
jgi:hypothetical protein